MKTITLLSALVLSTALFAQDGREALKSVGVIYARIQGACASHLDAMKWYDFEERGTITFAITNNPGARPMTGWSIAATTRADDLAPVGQGVFKMQPNQYVPIKSEMETSPQGDLAIYLHHKGKGSLGGIIIDAPSYPKENMKYEFFFSGKNTAGLYENLVLTYHDLKGLIPKKKVVCSFKLDR